jgi:hypothetical protein
MDPMPQRIDIVEGDITKLDIDAIVNACLAAAASTAPSTAPPDLSSARRAPSSAAARRERPRSRRAFVCLRAT